MFERIKKLIGREPARPLPTPAPAVAEAPRKSFSTAISAAMGSALPGNWSTDHREQFNHFTGWNFVAIRAIAQQCSQADVRVFRDRDNQKRYHAKRHKAYGDDSISAPVESSHPLYNLLQRPNPNQSGSDARYLIAMHLCLCGSAFVAKIPNRFNRTVQRFVLPQPLLTPVQPCEQYPRGAYRVASASSLSSYFADNGFSEMTAYGPLMGTTIPAEYMLTYRWPHPLFADDGYSATAAGAHWLDTSGQIDLSRWYQLRNGVDPSLIVSPKNPDTEWTKDEMKAGATEFNAQYTRPENHGKAIFTSGQTEVTKLSNTPAEMAYIEAHDQLRNAIMALHGVPLIAAGLSDGGSYAAFVASLKQFQTMTVQPLLSLMAERETHQQAPEFGGGLVVEYEAKGIDDPAVLESQIRTDVSAGAITVNELRRIRGREDLPYGDVPCRASSSVGTAAGGPVDERGAGGIVGADGDTSGMGHQGKPPALLGKYRQLKNLSTNGHTNAKELYP